MRRITIAVLGLLLGAAHGARAQSTGTLRGVDFYRSNSVTGTMLRSRFNEALRKYVSLRNEHRQSGDDKAEDVRLNIAREVLKMPGVAWADLEMTEFYTSSDHAFYAVFDIVDESDASRLAFTPLPRAHLPDPDGLLKAWRDFMLRGDILTKRGELSIDRPNCPSYYCIYGGTPELDAAHQKFVAGVASQGEALRRILAADSDGEKRSDALFVLSYSTAARDLVALCQDSLADSDSRVRGAALQILADIANHHNEVPIGLDRVLPRLDDPASAVRGKAMGLLIPLAERESYRSVLALSAPRLVALLQLAQPESSDLAYTLLRLLSKRTYTKNDIASWTAWSVHPEESPLGKSSRR